MKNTSMVGNVSESMAIAALVRRGKRVLIPFGSGAPYDMAYDDNGRLMRVEVKTGLLRNGAILFRNKTVLRNGQARTYHGIADVFVVYCAELNKCYMMPVADAGERPTVVSIRVSPTKRNRVADIRWAAQYEL